MSSPSFTRRIGFDLARFAFAAWPFARGRWALFSAACRLAEASPDLVVPTRLRGGGRLRTRVGDLIQRMVAVTGVWEPHLTAYLSRTLKPGDVFVDVGANVGYYAILAARLCGPTGAVVACEASPRIFATLQQNLALNAGDQVFAPVRALNVAVAAIEGTLTIHAGPEGMLGQTTVRPARGFPAEAEVPARPLPDLLSPVEAALARVIKIDVEGAELDVLDGLVPRLDAFPRADLMLEITPAAWAERGRDPRALFATLAGHGFRLFRPAADRSPVYLAYGRQPLERPRPFDPEGDPDDAAALTHAEFLDLIARRGDDPP